MFSPLSRCREEILAISRFSFCSSQRGLFCNSWSAPDIPVMGVRISWDIVAKKFAFTCLLTENLYTRTCIASSKPFTSSSKCFLWLRRSLSNSFCSVISSEMKLNWFSPTWNMQLQNYGDCTLSLCKSFPYSVTQTGLASHSLCIPWIFEAKRSLHPMRSFPSSTLWFDCRER